MNSRNSWIVAGGRTGSLALGVSTSIALCGSQFQSASFPFPVLFQFAAGHVDDAVTASPTNAKPVLKLFVPPLKL